jgi:hypothetical protein
VVKLHIHLPIYLCGLAITYLCTETSPLHISYKTICMKNAVELHKQTSEWPVGFNCVSKTYKIQYNPIYNKTPFNISLGRSGFLHETQEQHLDSNLGSLKLNVESRKSIKLSNITQGSNCTTYH